MIGRQFQRFAQCELHQEEKNRKIFSSSDEARTERNVETFYQYCPTNHVIVKQVVD